MALPFIPPAVLSTFTQADGALPVEWVNDPFHDTQPAPTVATNQMAFGTFGCAARWNTSFAAEQAAAIQVTVKPADGTGFVGVLLRLVDPSDAADTGDAYKVELGPVAGGSNDAVRVYRCINTADTQLGADIVTEYSAGDWLLGHVTGVGSTVTINIYRCPSASDPTDAASWTLIGSRADTDGARIVTGGYTGAFCYQSASTVTRVDNFRAGTISAGTTYDRSGILTVGP